MGEIAPMTDAAHADFRWRSETFVCGGERLRRTGPGRTGVLAVQSFRAAPQNPRRCRRMTGAQFDDLFLIAREQRGAQVSIATPSERCGGGRDARRHVERDTAI